jgi:hypothetical protein
MLRVWARQSGNHFVQALQTDWDDDFNFTVLRLTSVEFFNLNWSDDMFLEAFNEIAYSAHREADFVMTSSGKLVLVVSEPIASPKRNGQSPWASVSLCAGTLPANERYTWMKYTVASAMPMTHQIKPIFSP